MISKDFLRAHPPAERRLLIVFIQVRCLFVCIETTEGKKVFVERDMGIDLDAKAFRMPVNLRSRDGAEDGQRHIVRRDFFDKIDGALGDIIGFTG